MAEPDFSQMTEEQMLEYAMKVSMQDGSGFGGGGGGNGGATQQQPAASAGASPAPSNRSPPRTFPRKDPQDVFPQLSRGAKKPRGEPRAAEGTGAELRLSEAEASDLLKVIFGDRPEAPDVERWLDVGFQFSPVAGTEWGLWQRQGGPCGVFAPAAAFIVKCLLFGGAGGEVAEAEAARKERPLAMLNGEEDSRASVLAYALGSMLYQSAPTSSYVICQVTPILPGVDANAAVPLPATGSSDASVAAALGAAGMASGTGGFAVSGRRVGRVSDAIALLEEAVDAWLAGPYGVLSFVSSILLSRTLTTAREDMDDPSMPLIGRFGHCSQELVNLMLIGEAVSNVFDGTRWLSDDPSTGFLVKGIDGDRVGVPPVGFLSELEAMRYMQVGTLFKYPECPIWVLGSPTHYTLLFSTQKADAHLSKEAQLEQRAKKVFNDNALDEGSLAMASNLSKLIEGLGLGADRLPQAQTALVREDIILWEDFRAWSCRQFGLSPDGPAGESNGKKVKLFLYDGQDPPGPSVRSVQLELSDIDPRFAGGGADGDAFAATLHTRWPNAIVNVVPLAGSGAAPGAS